MRRIGLLSDTHGYLDERILLYLSECDEIWHAGDIGNLEIAQTLSKLKPFKAVYGNADGNHIRIEFPQNLRFKCEELDVWMTHIGGYPKHYAAEIKKELIANPPKLFITGHSHILKVIYDDKFGMLYINPGAVGIQGFHQVRTLVRFTVDIENIKDLEVVELGQRGIIPS
jgi:putative phosphoesterase